MGTGACFALVSVCLCVEVDVVVCTRVFVLVCVFMTVCVNNVIFFRQFGNIIF